MWEKGGNEEGVDGTRGMGKGKRGEGKEGEGRGRAGQGQAREGRESGFGACI